MQQEPARFPLQQAVDRLHHELGHRHLNTIWAKLEIFLGLLASGGGILLGMWAASRTEPDLQFACAGLMLFTFGGYLALAGSRSHLYQSNNRLAAYVAELVRNSKHDKQDSADNPSGESR
jgi:hypothetical protein